MSISSSRTSLLLRHIVLRNTAKKQIPLVSRFLFPATPQNNVLPSPPPPHMIQQSRFLGRRGPKGSAMGQHIKTLDQMAHEKSPERQKKLRKKQNAKLSHEDEDDDEEEEREEEAYEDDDDEEDDEEYDETILPDTNKVKSKMLAIISKMKESFKRIRGAEPTPELFEPIPVKAYGTLTPLNSVAQTVVTSPSLVTITPYDPNITTAVRDAIRDSGMNFNPRVEDGVVMVPIPKVSAETRKSIVKQVGSIAETCRGKVRGIRRKAHDVARKGRDGKLEGVSQDDAFRAEKEIDKVTHEVMVELDKLLEEKKMQVMAV